MAGKIAELKFEAPLARFEEEDTASLKNMNLLTGAKHRLVYFDTRPKRYPVVACSATLVWPSIFHIRRPGHVRPPKLFEISDK